MLGVTLGVGTVCFVMSMHNGFESEIRTRLLGTTSHISIFPVSEPFISNYRDLISSLESIDNVVAVSPFVYYKAAVSSASEGDGIIVRGIDPELEQKTSNISDDIKHGAYEFDEIIQGEDTLPAIILGSNLAERLGIYLGEPLLMYSIRGEDLTKRARPRVAKFYVSGIFETGMYEFDAEMAYIALSEAQKLFRTGDAVTAVHLKLSDIYLADKVAPIIDSVLGYKYDVVPWNVLHKNLFAWIAIEKKVLFIGFSLIVIVAGFSIISTLVMLTMEKRPEIAILKAIGSTPTSIRRIFIYQGLSIAGIGLLAGWFLAFGLAYIQNKFEIVKLPPDIYFVSYLPIQTDIWDFLAVGIVTVVVCFLAALYPAQQAARLPVIDILRK